MYIYISISPCRILQKYDLCLLIPNQKEIAIQN